MLEGDFRRTDLAKHLLLAMLALLSFCSLVDVVFGNPIPWDPSPENFVQCFTIVVAEFCGLVVGTAVFTYNRQIEWRKPVMTILIALIISYAVGIIIWGMGYLAGVLVFSPVNPFFIVPSYYLSPVILLLPEFIGTVLGAIIIRANQKVKWKTAFTTMTATMLTSFLVGFLMLAVYFWLRFG